MASDGVYHPFLPKPFTGQPLVAPRATNSSRASAFRSKVWVLPKSYGSSCQGIVPVGHAPSLNYYANTFQGFRWSLIPNRISQAPHRQSGDT